MKNILKSIELNHTFTNEEFDYITKYIYSVNYIKKLKHETIKKQQYENAAYLRGHEKFLESDDGKMFIYEKEQELKRKLRIQKYVSIEIEDCFIVEIGGDYFFKTKS